MKNDPIIKEVLAEIRKFNKEQKSTKTKIKFKKGDRVELPANEEEGWEKEIGIVDGSSGKDVYIVTIDREYRPDYDRDGLREVYVDDMKLLA